MILEEVGWVGSRLYDEQTKKALKSDKKLDVFTVDNSPFLPASC